MLSDLKKYRVCTTYIILTICALFFFAWMLCARGSGIGWMDDMAYSRVYRYGVECRDYFLCPGPPIESIADSINSIIPHYLFLNGRLANFLMLFYLHLPPWLGCLLQGVAIWFMMAGIMRLGIGREWSRHTLAMACMVVFVWLFFPWWDMYASADFMINYVWSSALCLWALIVMFSVSENTKLRWLWLIVPAALMHEGFSCAISAGMIMYILTDYRHYMLHKRLLVLPLTFMVVSLIPTLSPGIVGQAIDRSASMDRDLRFLVYVIIGKNIPVFFTAIIYMIWGVRHGCMRKSMVYVSMIIVASILAISAAQGGRSMWIGYLLSAAMWLHMCHKKKIGIKIYIICTTLLMLIFIWWGVQVCSWQYRCTKERDAAMSELLAGHPEGYYILTPVTNYNQLPWWLFDMVMTVGDNTKPQRTYMYCFTGNRTYYENFAIMPPAPTLEQSIASLPVLPSGMRGNKYCIVSNKRIPSYLMRLEISAESDAEEEGWHPLYSLRRYKETQVFKIGCDETPLRLSNGDSLYVYRPLYMPHSFYNHRLLNATPFTDY